ncbi:MAG: hypothetical protein AB7E96_12235 [Deferribacterales bacterium]
MQDIFQADDTPISKPSDELIDMVRDLNKETSEEPVKQGRSTGGRKLYSLDNKSRARIEKRLLKENISIKDTDITQDAWDKNKITLRPLQSLADRLGWILNTVFLKGTAEIAPVGGTEVRGA